MKYITLLVIALAMLCSSFNSLAQIPSGAKVRYLFNNNYADSSGNALHGTGTNTTFVTDRFGNPNSACYFDGTAVINTSYMLNSVSSGYTLCMWVKNDLIYDPSTRAYFISNFRAPTSQLIPAPSFTLSYDALEGYYVFGYNDANLYVAKDLPYNNNANQWTHIACVWNGNSINLQDFSIYINGQLQTTLNHYYNPFNVTYSAPVSSSFPFVLGNLSGDLPYVGIMDDITIYERALTPIEIDSVYKDAPCISAVIQSVTISVTPGMSVGPFTPITFSASTVDAGTNPSFQWMVNNVDIPNETASTFTSAMLRDNDIVNVKMISHDACDSKHEVLSNTLTIHINTGIDASVKSNIAAYPTIVKDILTIQTDCKDCGLTVTDAAGRILQKIMLHEGVNTVDMVNLPAGNYFLKYSDGAEKKTITVTKQ